MKEIEITPIDIDLKQYVKRSALESDYETLIKDDCIVHTPDKGSILYKKLDWDFGQMENALRGIKYQKTERTGGLKTTSRVFGYQPRIALRRDYCTATSLALQEKEKNETVCNYGKRIIPIYKDFFPHVFEKHEQEVEERILPEWKIEGSPFTSGIINENNPLKYHFDSGNFKRVCSCMLVFKTDIDGGYLAVPELNVGFELVNHSLLIFDGQSLLHGVTPIRKLTPRAKRYTVVYYSLEQMWKCEPLSEELARIRAVKTQRERKRTQHEEAITMHTEAEKSSNTTGDSVKE